MPIIGEPGRANDVYIPQLVANAEAAVAFLVESGIADSERIAVGGRSYGAFSAANLLVHTRLFRSGIAMSGAYNRTLTPFGFQHERRSFWEETALYAEISPFFFADRIEAPLLLVHGREDPNAGTPREQARRFFHALVGNRVPVRYVELPHEGHHYWARESVFHVASELLEWLEQTLGSPTVTSGGPGSPDQ
jgi:dipeptidyl aminopeptidase/acylaminoacyl peptidase